MRIFGWIGRFFVSLIAIWIVSWIVPGFSVGGVRNALCDAFVITVLASFVERIWGETITPFQRGMVGFFVTATIIGITKLLLQDVNISLIGTVFIAVGVGVADLFFPNKRAILDKKKFPKRNL